MTERKSETKLGNVYAIPGGGKFALGKIVFASEYFKDVILIRLFEKSFLSLTELPSEMDSLSSRQMFTGAESIKKGGWKIVGNAPVSDAEKAMSRRIVGGDVWVEDDHLGPASEQDIASLKNMDIYGYRLIEKAVARL